MLKVLNGGMKSYPYVIVYSTNYTTVVDPVPQDIFILGFATDAVANENPPDDFLHIAVGAFGSEVDISKIAFAQDGDTQMFLLPAQIPVSAGQRLSLKTESVVRQYRISVIYVNQDDTSCIPCG